MKTLSQDTPPPFAGRKHLTDTSAFFRAIACIAVAALVMLGLGGSIYNLVSPGGWLAQVFGRSIAGGIAAVLALFMVGVCAWMTRDFVAIDGRDRRAEWFVYGFAATGLFYAYQFLAKGDF